MDKEQLTERLEHKMIDLYSSEDIGVKLLNRKFTDNEISKLSSGEMIHWKNMDIGGQAKRELGIRMQTYVNEQNEIVKGMDIVVKPEKLEVPEEIMGHKLNKDEKESLEKGDFFCVERDKKKFLINIDTKSNSVLVRVPAEMGIKEELGGYKFGKNELADLANGKTLGAKVYHSDKYGHYMANLQINRAKGGRTLDYKYTNVASLSAKEAQALAPILNNNLTAGKQSSTKAIVETLGLDTLTSQKIAQGSPNKGVAKLVAPLGDTTPKEIKTSVKALKKVK